MSKRSKPPGSGPGRPGGIPPVEHRWPPSVSGNPGGRPKKKPSLRDRAGDILEETVRLTLNNKVEEVSRAEYLLRTTFSLALNKPRDLLSVFRWLEGDLPPHKGDENDAADDAAAADDEIIQAAFARALRRQIAAAEVKPTRRRTKTRPDEEGG